MSAGPKAESVGSGLTQLDSSKASRDWMIRRENRRSPFWQFIERISPDRMDIAWTNVSKMDRLEVSNGDAGPPSPKQWPVIAGPCLQALSEEIHCLAPALILFATSRFRAEIKNLLAEHGFLKSRTLGDGHTTIFRSANGTSAITTRHPGYWRRMPQARDEQIVATAVLNLLNRQIKNYGAHPPSGALW